MTRKQFLRHLAAGLFVSAFSGWGRSAGTASGAGDSRQASWPTRDHPLVTEPAERKVLLYCEVHGKGLASSNPHWGVVFRGGKLHDKAILKAFAPPGDFFDALVRIGARPGNNMNEESYGVAVSGDVLEVSATWQGLGRELTLGDIFSDEAGKGFQIRFGGNRVAAGQQKTGCITCLESCWIGVTSNSRYPYVSSFRRALNPNSRFQGKKNHLPGDGSPVILIYRIADVR